MPANFVLFDGVSIDLTELVGVSRLHKIEEYDIMHPWKYGVVFYLKGNTIKHTFSRGELEDEAYYDMCNSTLSDFLTTNGILVDG